MDDQKPHNGSGLLPTPDSGAGAHDAAEVDDVGKEAAQLELAHELHRLRPPSTNFARAHGKPSRNPVKREALAGQHLPHQLPLTAFSASTRSASADDRAAGDGVRTKRSVPQLREQPRRTLPVLASAARGRQGPVRDDVQPQTVKGKTCQQEERTNPLAAVWLHVAVVKSADGGVAGDGAEREPEHRQEAQELQGPWPLLGSGAIGADGGAARDGVQPAGRLLHRLQHPRRPVPLSCPPQRLHLARGRRQLQWHWHPGW
mmetsp:Transcript_75409/g.234739  ORF Transcript_75409/g.234739 Transcript_75409/m.234739 type:complete len:259 (-) Transcript_75409:2-778(-)